MIPGRPIVVSAPSGTGKTTLCRKVQERLDGVAFSVSHTTRGAREGEKEGVDYHFVDVPTFKQAIEQSLFFEWAQVHGNYYGTHAESIEEQLRQGNDVFCDIDVQGGLQIKKRSPDALLVYILPPSYEELERRLRGRGTDSEEVVQRRLTAAKDEIISAIELYDLWIVNQDLEDASLNLEAAIRCARLNAHQPKDLCTSLGFI